MVDGDQLVAGSDQLWRVESAATTAVGQLSAADSGAKGEIGRHASLSTRPAARLCEIDRTSVRAEPAPRGCAQPSMHEGGFFAGATLARMRATTAASTMFVIASLAACGGNVVSDPHVVPSDAAGDVAGDAVGDIKADSGGEITLVPGDAARVAALAEPCRRTGNTIVMNGYFSDTIRDGGWDTGARLSYVRVSGGVSSGPSAEVEFSTDGLGIDLAPGLYANTTTPATSAMAGRPSMSTNHGSDDCGGKGWFQVLDIKWSDAAGSRLTSFTAVFEQVYNPYVTDDTRVYGCVHFESP